MPPPAAATTAASPSPPPSPSLSLADSRARLLSLFASSADADVPRKWADLWAQGSFLPFDRGRPNPALEDLLAQRQDLVGTAFSPAAAGTTGGKGRRRRALVPGCGRGYDVLLLAAFGFDAVGLDVSADAVRACEVERGRVWGEGRKEGGEEEEDEEDVYRVRDTGVGRGKARFVAGDFFEVEGWAGGVFGDEEETGEGMFDLVYDYTFLSALPPSLRPRWASTMARLLVPAGRLVCLEFPTYKDPASGGPPWACPSDVYLGLLGRPGKEMEYDGGGRIVLGEKDRRALEGGRAVEEGGMMRLAHFMPDRTHEIGKGTDWVSVWTRGDGR